MRILIIGGGGLGTVLAGYLARAGSDVTLLVKPEQAAAFEGEKVHITGLADFTAPVHVASDLTGLGAFHYLIVCVKARDTEAALAPIAGARVETVLSLQNGVAKDEILVRTFGRERVLGALTGIGGTVQRPGHALHSLAGPTLVGELDGGLSPRGERLAAAIAATGLPAECVPDILTREWHKLVIFLRTALVCSITHITIPSAMLDPDLMRVCMRVAREVAGVAAAEGYAVDRMPVWLTPSVTFGSPDEKIEAALAVIARQLNAQGVPLYPSLAQDTIAGRPTELEATAGDVLARAQSHGIDTPTLAACYHLLRGLERGTVSPRRHGGTEE